MRHLRWFYKAVEQESKITNLLLLLLLILNLYGQLNSIPQHHLQRP